MARKKHKSTRRSKGFGGTIWATIVGVGLYIAYEVFISPMLPFKTEPTLSIVELALGLAFIKKGGWVGAVAKTAVVLNVYSLMNAYVKPALMPSQ